MVRVSGSTQGLSQNVIFFPWVLSGEEINLRTRQSKIVWNQRIKIELIINLGQVAWGCRGAVAQLVPSVLQRFQSGSTGVGLNHERDMSFLSL